MGIKELREDFHKQDKKFSSKFHKTDQNGVKKPEWGKILVTWLITLLAISMIAGVIFSAGQVQTTDLYLRSADATIGVNQTEYTIEGSTDINSTVTLSSSKLDLNGEIVDVESNGDFSYTITIPENITDIDIDVSSKAPDKLESYSSIHLERPTTSLSVDSVNFTDNDTSLMVSGKTEPNAEVNISSSNLNLTNITITADSNGEFEYRVSVPDDKNSFTITVKAQVTGKKVGSDSLYVSRKITIKETPDVVTSSDSDNSSSSLDSSSSSSSSSADSTQVIITRYGEKYHMYKHGNMKHISWVPLSQAKGSYSPCSVCC